MRPLLLHSYASDSFVVDDVDLLFVVAFKACGVRVGYLCSNVHVVLNVILLSCQPRVTVRSCFVNTFIRDLESIDHLCINPIRRIG